MLKLLLLVVLSLALTIAEEPLHCYAPPELSFKAHMFNHELTTFSKFRAQWDARHRRVAYHEEHYDGPQPGKQYIRMIFLYDADVAYEYNEKTTLCKKFKPGKFYPLGVPFNAKLEAEFFVGGPGEAIDAMEYSDRTDFKREDWYGVFTRTKCYPIRTFLRNNYNNHSITTNYIDIVEGIADPYMFMPPASCLTAGPMVDMSHRARDYRSISARSFL